ncbi:Vibriobactin utilization protein ViuB [Streptomyces sp. YIM 130001]|uniref:siderophore-interacting protein n=1 Tax=Streptomyces sp. YIM 130001 TaxID=2259644 RepID=UPI000E646A29|nr:siderophore-interacting protein [Streptomyces sp. YIM 130001]RII18740.1 Vibriobactin utilization protein ViuB [Streptomyces sp. YIM 130001]
MAERPERKKPKAHLGEVLRTETLTPHMQRVTLGGDGLSEFQAGDCTDHYVKLLFPPEGVSYPEPFDIQQIRAELPRDQWPTTRTYTVRSWDPESRELVIDFVVHGDEGLAGPWAANVKPGETLRFQGPGGGYAPGGDADWHLLVGDESALPAVAAAIERMPAGALVHAFVEVSGPEEEQQVTGPEGVEIVYLHRGRRPVGQLLVETVSRLDFPAGRVQAFVHGEAGFVKEIRRQLRVDREIPREDLSISGYWRLGHNEDGWQASKRDWNATVEAEQEADTAVPQAPAQA